jgi:plasmid stabilization system protein ParE
MTPRFVFHAGAAEDLRDAFGWYEEQRQGLGDELGAVLEAALDRIAANPNLYPEIAPDVRRCVLSRFPYGLFYRVRAARIEVLAVFHHRRDPQVWHRRAAV